MPTSSRLPARTSARATLGAGLVACITALQAAPAMAAAPVTNVSVQQTDASGRPSGPVFFERIQPPAAVVQLNLASFCRYPGQALQAVGTGATIASLHMLLTPH